ncbi:hypothetical protein [Pseudorhodoplanes sinuspersici]|uniref:Uncharacterized protein n=1 Tax=Pseudorhodoplanes sinuspersici TaxID=1235591 RepID=A0A1W6ZRK8_9HYPH|nr:hypothetical protein [Pseudorhodoplanes sinuspersici]ARQ00010.1 hypothetical protein CAK95_13630 [Pseudorhodoplanes sinuspersici]RKE71042.1 hypothetical protein DFP91_3296 [Pseudorhodoplanes sinuspersici]
MGLLDFLRRSKPPIKDVGQLGDFIDEQSAFLVQKGIYDYTRARSGHFAKVMLTDKGFQNALDRSRWRAYPLGLAMVGETVEGMLAVHSMEDRRATLDPLIKLVLSVFDRYPKPAAVSDDEWEQARADLALHLQRLSTHPPKRVIDIPEPFAERYFAMMPFDKPFLTPDAPTARSFMQLQLVTVQEELLKRMDAAQILQNLRQTFGDV